MNGNSFLLDTNVLLYLTGGTLDLAALPDGEFAISFVTELEVLSYPSITATEEEKLKKLLQDLPILDIPREIKDLAITLRKKHRLKLPDAIVAASAMHLGATLLTNDKGFSSITGLKTLPALLNKAQ